MSGFHIAADCCTYPVRTYWHRHISAGYCTCQNFHNSDLLFLPAMQLSDLPPLAVRFVPLAAHPVAVRCMPVAPVHYHYTPVPPVHYTHLYLMSDPSHFRFHPD